MRHQPVAGIIARGSGSTFRSTRRSRQTWPPINHDEATTGRGQSREIREIVCSAGKTLSPHFERIRMDARSQTLKFGAKLGTRATPQSE